MISAEFRYNLGTLPLQSEHYYARINATYPPPPTGFLLVLLPQPTCAVVYTLFAITQMHQLISSQQKDSQFKACLEYVSSRASWETL